MSAAARLLRRRQGKTAHALIGCSTRGRRETTSIRARILDTLPHRLLWALLPLDRLYRSLVVPLNQSIYSARAHRQIEEIVKQSVVDEVHIEATNICNASCRFCAYRLMERPKRVMELGDFQRYVDQIVAAGVETFDLTAIVGDPFTDALLFERLAYLRTRAAKTISLTTNAIAMPPHKTDRIISFAESFCGDLLIRISFGGFDRQTYHKIFQVDRFDRVVKNIMHLLERRQELKLGAVAVELHVRCPLSGLKGPTYRMFRDYESRGLLTIRRRVNRDLRYGNWGGKVKPEEIRSVGLTPAPRPKRFFGPCDLMFSRGFVVTLDGTVNACACRDVEVSLPIGNLNDEAFIDVIRGARRHRLMAEMMQNRIPPFCRECSEYRSIFSPDADFYRQFLKRAQASPR